MANEDARIEESSETDTTAGDGTASGIPELPKIPSRKSLGNVFSRGISLDVVPRVTDQQSTTSIATPVSGGIASDTSSATNVPTPETPSIDEQIAQVTEICQRDFKEGQKGFVVSNKWLSRVLARGSTIEGSDKFSKTAREGPIGPVDNAGINLITDPSVGVLKDEAGDIYVPLKPGLNITEDFEVLPQAAWGLVSKWYGLDKASPIITRYCHNTSTSETTENLQWELYPPVFTILKVPFHDGVTTKTLREKDATPIRILASRHDSYRTFLKQAKEQAGIDMKTKVRVWRILGGLDKGSQGGMITPAASRSNSPAPGALISVDPGDRMVLDVNTFVGLQIGSHRELVDTKDETANEKYNGHISLDLVGLRQDEVIVLEEQVGGPAGGHFPSDAVISSKAKSNVNLSVTKNGATTIQNALKSGTVNSRSTSPAPGGMMTRGRQAKNGRTRGSVGLSNLGNTCYMNSALQCVRSAEELTQYFLEDKHKSELNPSNPLSHNGNVAKSYAALLHEMYGTNAVSSFAPRTFKNTIGRYGPSFSGYQQQDSQEFLLFLLDGLQEDLNRIHKKPYIEKPDSTDEMVHNPAALKDMADKCWNIYKARNDSVITDLFAGMYKSTVVCPACEKVSIIFDPFNNLTLQLPIESLWSRKILVFPLDMRPVVVSVDIDKNATFAALKAFVAGKVGIDPQKTMVAELYKHAFYKIFDDSKSISEETIVDSDTIGIWEFEEQPTNFPPPKKKPQRNIYNYNTHGDVEDIPNDDSPVADKMLVPVFHRRLRGLRQNNVFGSPSFIVVNRQEARDHDTILRKVLSRIEMMTTRDFLREGDDSEGQTNDSPAEDSDTVLMNSDEASEVQSKSLGSEDGMVDISMPDAKQDKQATPETQTKPLVQPTQKPIAPMLKPGSFITPGVRNLFEMKVIPSGKTMIPTGINYISEERRDYDSVQSRQPALPIRQKSSLKEKIEQRQSILQDTSPSSDEDIDNTLPSAPAQNHTQNYDSGSDDDGIPPVEPIRQPSTGFSRFNKSARRDSKGLITYSRKDKRAAAKSQVSKETTPVERGPLLHLGESILCDWNLDAYEALFTGVEADDDDEQMRGQATWDHILTLEDPELEEKRRVRSSRKKNGVTLDDCLDEFGKAEVLSENDAWYCPRCKEHRRASKKFELWKAPDILVVHLKRFSAQGRLRDKLDVHVDFPIEGLDLSTRLAAQDDGRSPIYDLFAVDNHYGGLGGGHYTAYAQNFLDKQWYEYNDSIVSRRADPNVVVTSAAYLLFYRRRSATPLGGPFFERLMAEANTPESQASSRAPSPAGEGKRLDDSSRIGSSSALRGVGAAHQAGGGGSVDGAGVSIVRKGIDDNDPADDLPAYSKEDPQDTMNMNNLQADTLESMETDEDEGLGLEDGPHSAYHGPYTYQQQRQWSFGSNGLAPVNNSPRTSGGEGEGPEEDLFEDDSSTKVAKSSVSLDEVNRMADFQDDEGTTHHPFGTPPEDAIPLLDVPAPVEADEPVAEVMLEDELARDLEEGAH